jgi:hypothetical protein
MREYVDMDFNEMDCKGVNWIEMGDREEENMKMDL